MRAAGRWLVLAIVIASATPALAMRMEVIGDQVILSGGVNVGDAEQLRKLLDANPGKVTTVVLRNSGGGDANTGFAIGDLIRARGLRTALAGYCRSSCSRMFLGGVERIFTDAEPAGRTYVAFHGNYDDAGRVKLENAWRLKEWIVAHSDGKADPALIDRWTTIRNRRGFMYFFDSNRLHRRDGISVFLCSGDEPADDRLDHCEKIAGRTGYDLGIFTSGTVVPLNR